MQCSQFFGSPSTMEETSKGFECKYRLSLSCAAALALRSIWEACMCTLQRKGSKSKRMAAAGRHTRLPLHQHDRSDGPSGDNDSDQKRKEKKNNNTRL